MLGPLLLAVAPRGSGQATEEPTLVSMGRRCRLDLGPTGPNLG
jgi:hypothetical protein